jgi:hypothetical protein
MPYGETEKLDQIVVTGAGAKRGLQVPLSS